jgi:hypothetical protein
MDENNEKVKRGLWDGKSEPILQEITQRIMGTYPKFSDVIPSFSNNPNPSQIPLPSPGRTIAGAYGAMLPNISLPNPASMTIPGGEITISPKERRNAAPIVETPQPVTVVPRRGGVLSERRGYVQILLLGMFSNFLKVG